ncbi:MAG: hypothetical protein VYE68_14350 [Acidobacteriota bacterium]|nr:hypothetical protein [Acidobacteriota bacterium]
MSSQGGDAGRVAVTGASRFDEFFEREPSESRDALCARFGFDPHRPIVAYLGSSPFVSPHEPDFVNLWIDHLRGATDDVVRTTNILVRPHPRSSAVWTYWDGNRWDRVGVYGTAFLGDQALFDCLCHADVVVALNTSAQLEAGILGKLVLTVLPPDHAPGQQGSLHFEYLLDRNGGHVQVGTTLAEHLDQLAEALVGEVDATSRRRVMEAFIRPAGWDEPVSPLLSDAIEQWMTTRPRPQTGRWISCRRRVSRVVAGADPADDAAVAAVVKFRVRGERRAREERVRRERKRAKVWKEQARQLSAELEAERRRSRGDPASKGPRDQTGGAGDSSWRPRRYVPRRGGPTSPHGLESLVGDCRSRGTSQGDPQSAGQGVAL